MGRNRAEQLKLWDLMIEKMKEFEYVYLLETDDGDILSGNVLLGKELSINY